MNQLKKKTSDSYYNHDDSKKTWNLSPKIPWVRTAGSSLIQWINILKKQNSKKHLFFDQKKKGKAPEAWKD